MKSIICLGIICTMFFYSCSNNPVTPENNQPSNYEKIFTTGTGSNRFEIYSATSNNLRSGYNDVGFKVFQNNQEMQSGYVKFSAHMWHNQPNNSTHQTPVSPQFNFNDAKQLFTGYMSFIMISDSLSHWFGFFNYNDVMHIDSIPFTVLSNPASQIRGFIDNQLQTSFYITLVSPMSPMQGLNDFKCLLHKSQDDIIFTEVDSAQMAIFPWMHLMGHGSSNNENPVYIGNGIYSGKVNFNMSGEWYVYDTITYQGRVITPINDPPKFIIQAP